ncbi:MAG: Glucose 1-dehydrogenase 4 [Chlamydiae bacterium]|nr:Glucose 1-dehydrogenase 4 [Chlamydiota bacterium]
MISLKDKVILITGGARRLGRAISLGLPSKKFILHYNQSKRSAVALQKEIQRNGGCAEIFQADFKDLSSIKSLFDFTKKKFGRLDVLINSACIFENQPFESITDFESTLRVNLLAPLMCAHQALKLMSNGSTIINLCDISAIHPFRNYPLHSISKAALLHSTQVLALELAPKIRVNSLLLGMILPSEGFPKKEFDEICNKRILLKRAGKPEEVTHALSFLIENEYMNASVLTLDGGRV